MLKGIVITNKGHRVEDRSKSSQSKNVGGQSFVGEHITVLINFLLLLFIMIISCCYEEKEFSATDLLVHKYFWKSDPGQSWQDSAQYCTMQFLTHRCKSRRIWPYFGKTALVSRWAPHTVQLAVANPHWEKGHEDWDKMSLEKGYHFILTFYGRKIAK